MSNIIWEWYDNQGWKSYSVKDSKIIEAHYIAGESEVSLLNNRYTVDLERMCQVNKYTKFKRNVRRIVNKTRLSTHYLVLWESETFREFLVGCKDGVVIVHRCMIEANAPLLLNDPDFLIEFEEVYVKIFLYYMYTNMLMQVEIEIIFDEIFKFITVCSEEFGYSGLARHLVSLIESKMDAQLAKEILEYCDHSSTFNYIRNRAVGFYQKNCVKLKLKFPSHDHLLQEQLTPIEYFNETREPNTDYVDVLYKKSLGCDVTLHVTDIFGQESDFQLHKALLDCQSKFFLGTFHFSRDDNVIAHTTPLSMASFECMVEYIYSGKINYHDAQSAVFFSAWGEFYQLECHEYVERATIKYLKNLEQGDIDGTLLYFENNGTHEIIYDIISMNEEKHFLSLSLRKGFMEILKHREILNVVGQSNLKQLEEQLFLVSSQMSEYAPTTIEMQQEMIAMNNEISVLRNDISQIKTGLETIMNILLKKNQ